MDFKNFLLAIITDWIALMSGIASVTVAIIGVAKKWEKVPRWTFWLTAVVCFFVSSIRIWTTEHRARLAVEKQLEQLTIPRLYGEVEFISFVPKEQGVIVAVFATIKNNGAPSIAEIGPVKVTLPDGRVVETVPLGVPYNGMAVKLPDQGGTAMFPRQDYLPIKTMAQPIPTGGAVSGWTWGLAKNLNKEQISDPNSIIILGFADVRAKPYEMRKSLKDAKIEVIDPSSLRDVDPLK